MLGLTNVKDFIQGSDTVDIKPQIIAEWNMNSIASSFIHGTENYPTSFVPLTLQAVSSSLPPTTITETSNFDRTFYSPVFNDNSSQLVISSSQSIVASVTASVMTNGVAGLLLKNKINITPGDTIFVEGVGALFDGVYIAGPQTNGIIINYDTNNPSGNSTFKESPVQGAISSSSNEYYVDFSLTSFAAKSAKIFLKLKSDYIQQSQSSQMFLEEFNVNLRAVGTLSGQVIYTQSITKNYMVNSTSWTDAYVSFANPDSIIDKVRLYLTIDTPNDSKAGLLVDQIFAANVSDYEVYTEDRTPLSQVFMPNRPGEVLIDSGPQNVEINTTLSHPQQPTPTQMAHKYAIGDLFEKVQRSITPFSGNPYSYYISGSGWGSKRTWCIYDREIKTNKIVIKVNAIAAKPKMLAPDIPGEPPAAAFNIKLLINKSWVKISSTSMSFNTNGIIVLYWNGTAWTTTPWTSNTVPTISESSGVIDKYVTIQGIAFDCLFQEYTLENSQLNKPDALEVLELVEISPRLELNLTKFVKSVKINKELDSSGIPLPIGITTSNTSIVDLSNIPITIGQADTNGSEDNDVVPISNYSQSSPLYGLLVKGVKIKGSFNLDIGTASGVPNVVNIPSFIMYSERWAENGDRVTVESFDAIKRLQSTKARPLFLRDKTLNEIMYSILDSVGFGDYYFDELSKLKIVKYKNRLPTSLDSTVLRQSVEYFWANEDNSVIEVINELLKVYQVSLYTDEYGAIRFISLYQINEKLKLVDESNVLYIQDMNETLPSSKLRRSNLKSLSFEEIERPQKITLKYKKPMPSLSDYRQRRNRPNVSMTQQATDIVWEPEEGSQVLSFFELASPGILTPTQNRIPFDVSSIFKINRAIENEGHLLIDHEILKYEGIEYKFSYKNSSGNSVFRIEVIKNKSDIDTVISEIYQTDQVSDISWTPTGYLVNVERGCFGTTQSAHKVVVDGSRVGWLGREFNSSYKQVSTIDEGDGSFGASNGNISIKCLKESGGILIYPSSNNTVGNKRKLFARYVLNNVPSGKSGSLGCVVGLKMSSGEITDGLFIWTGITNKNKNTTITISIIQIVGGQVKVVSAPKDFDFSDDLFSEDEAMEMYVEFNSQMNNMKVFIGSTSLFQVVNSKEDEKDPSKRKVAFKTLTTPISPIKKEGFFGFAALENGRGLLDALAFTANSDPRNLNDLTINNLEDGYYSSSSTTPAYYANADTLLNQIIFNRFITGFNTFKDSFIFTGAPVARGIKIWDVEYQDYPVIASPEVEFLGYTYDIEAVKDPTYITGVEGDK